MATARAKYEMPDALDEPLRVPEYPARPLPEIDDRLVAPGSGYEIFDGVIAFVPPALPPHAERHSKVAWLVEGHAAAEFKVACDMLTRTSEIDDIAPDVSVFPIAVNPETGGRQLEQLVFEVVGADTMKRTGRRAAKLSKRGVRRIVAIDVDKEIAYEWSAERRGWLELEPEAEIIDPSLGAPLPVRAMLGDAKVDDDVARALLYKRNQVLVANRTEAFTEGRSQGLEEGLGSGRIQGFAHALLGIFLACGIPISDEQRSRILDERDPEQLKRWIARAAGCNSFASVIGEA